MNKTVILLFISLAVLILSIICVCVAPIINNLLGNFTSWGKDNCQYFSDKAKYTHELDEKFIAEKYRNICIRQNAMYGLEYTAFIFDLCLGFLCAQLSLLHYFNAGKSFEKKTGLIGIIGGGIGFIITLIYVCFSGYIFNNDVAYRDLNGNGGTKRLYSNGASFKDLTNHIYVYSHEIDEDAEFVKYKDLGDMQYNYNKEYYEAYYNALNDGKNDNNCFDDPPSTPTVSIPTSGCEYYYPQPNVEIKNKYLYDRWCLSLVLAVFITVLNAGIIVFGLLLFLNKGGPGEEKLVEIK
jgi:hypothetical protein